MKREELKNLGLTDEQIGSVMAMNGTDVNGLREQVNALTTDRDGQSEQLKTVTGQLNQLQSAHKDDEDLQKEINSLKEANKQAESKHQSELEDAKKSYLTDMAITQAGAKNGKAVRALLDADELKLDKDGKLIGIDEQLKALKSADDSKFLFADADQGKQQSTQAINVGGNPSTSGGNSGDSVVDHVAARLAAAKQ